MAALKLAKAWQMEDIRMLAVETLSDLSSDIPLAQKAAYARDYEIVDWVLPTLRELARRTESLTLDEGHTLGMDWTIKMARVRESYVPPSAPTQSPSAFGQPANAPRLFGNPAQQPPSFGLFGAAIIPQVTVTCEMPHTFCPSSELM